MASRSRSTSGSSPADGSDGALRRVRGFIAAALSQIVDTLIFITISFYGVRPIWELMLGQMLAKVVLSAVLVPVIILSASRSAAGSTRAARSFARRAPPAATAAGANRPGRSR